MSAAHRARHECVRRSGCRRSRIPPGSPAGKGWPGWARRPCREPSPIRRRNRDPHRRRSSTSGGVILVRPRLVGLDGGSHRHGQRIHAAVDQHTRFRTRHRVQRQYSSRPVWYAAAVTRCCSTASQLGGSALIDRPEPVGMTRTGQGSLCVSRSATCRGGQETWANLASRGVLFLQFKTCFLGIISAWLVPHTGRGSPTPPSPGS